MNGVYGCLNIRVDMIVADFRKKVCPLEYSLDGFIDIGERNIDTGASNSIDHKGQRFLSRSIYIIDSVGNNNDVFNPAFLIRRSLICSSR